jgi:hypothetical protein
MKFLNLSFKVLVAIFFVIPLSAYAQLADSPWPMFHGDVRHTGLSKDDTSRVDGTIKWTFEAGGGIESSPVIGVDGTIYFGAHDNKFYAVNPDGTLKWKFNAGEPVYDKEWNTSSAENPGSLSINLLPILSEMLIIL